MFDPFDFNKLAENFRIFSERSRREQPNIFEAFLQGFHGGFKEPLRGEDLRLDLAIDFDDAVLGCEKEIRIPRLEITEENEFEQIIKSVKVNIPAGIRQGDKLRLKEQGDVCKHGGRRGDLYVFLIFSLQDKERKRNGINIESEIKITKSQAISGCKILVKTTKGEKTIFVPSGTKNGDFLVLRGHGVCQLGVPGKNGDHVIKFVFE
jgi:DnaJ-class molecular chaperone